MTEYLTANHQPTHTPSHTVDPQHGIIAHGDSPAYLDVSMERNGITYSGRLYAPRMPMVASMTLEQQNVFCEASHKLLCRLGERGLYLFCKECRQSHLIPWEKIDDMRHGVQ